MLRLKYVEIYQLVFDKNTYTIRTNRITDAEPQINIPKRKQLIDTGSNEIFNKPSEKNDYKSILNTSNKKMAKIIKRVEKLSTKNQRKQNQLKHKQNPKI